MKFYPKFSGNAIAFDHKGITKLLEDLENLFGADRERFFITGFSGGGTYAYFATMRDIGRWRASAPRNPNYYPQNWAGGHMKQLPKSEIYLPVHIFTSEKDEYKECIRDPKVPGIEPQTKNACAALNGMHFACVLRTEVPGVTHNESPKYYDQIFNWFDKVIAGTQVSGESPNYWPKK
jgi:dienelactone hydrolase